MTSKEALNKIIEYIKYKRKDEHIPFFVEFHKDYINKDLERLEQLEDNIKIHKETIKMQHNQIESLQSENAKLKKVIEFIKENFEVELHYDEEYDEYTICFMEYDECLEEIAITGITKYVNKEEYDLLKECLDD